jgi:phosphodiesterase/alkaline phosphatase D-like protein
MTTLLQALAIGVLTGGLLLSNPTSAQLTPSAKKDPKSLTQMVKSHIRLNQGHRYTIFRVRLDDLKPRTTYYYRVDSMDERGTTDGVISPVKTFRTP